VAGQFVGVGDRREAGVLTWRGVERGQIRRGAGSVRVLAWVGLGWSASVRVRLAGLRGAGAAWWALLAGLVRRRKETAPGDTSVRPQGLPVYQAGLLAAALISRKSRRRSPPDRKMKKTGGKVTDYWLPGSVETQNDSGCERRRQSGMIRAV